MIGAMRTASAFFGLLFAACGTAPAQLPDGSLSDLGVADLGPTDSGPALDMEPAPDSGADGDGGLSADLGFDAGVAEDSGADAMAMAMGFGTIAGPCERLDTELTDSAPSYFQTRLDFMSDGFDDPAERPLLTAGAQQILADGTAGGSSGLSEAFAFEVLARCEGAAFVKSETEIVYDVAGSMTDILVTIDGEPIGVSVTRAFIFPPSDPYPLSEADRVLREKLEGIQESSANVSAADAWTKQVLAVIAYGDMHADQFMAAWNALDGSLRADTILYVIVTDGDDDALY